MVEGGKITLRFEIDNEQFKRVMNEINKDLDKFKQKATEAGTGADKLGAGVKKAGEQSASAAINFQTMTQGAINLTTSFAQTYASISNIQRAHTSLAQSVVSLDRAEDQLQRKQFKLNQELAKAVPNMEKVALLQNEIGTAMDDYAVKQQKVKDTQDQLNDTQMLFAVNLVNVGFSAIQTGKSMIELGKSMSIASTASAIFNSTMGKVALIATAVILAMEGVVAVAKAMNLEWADQIPSLSNLGNAINKTFTTSDQILANSKKNLEDYGSSWKTATKTVGEETDKQTQLVKDWQNAQRVAIGQMHIEMGRAFGTTRNFTQAPEKGAVGLPANIPHFLLPYALAVNRKGIKSQISNGNHFDATSIFARDFNMYTTTGRHLRLGASMSGNNSFFDAPMGNAGVYHQEFWKDSTLSSFGTFDQVKEYQKALHNYQLALSRFRQFLKDDPEEFNRLNLWEEMGRAEVAIVEIEAFLEKVGQPSKSGKPDLSQFTPNTSFSSGTEEEVATGFAEVARSSFKASKDYMDRARRTNDPKLRREYMELARQYQTAGYKYVRMGQGVLDRQFNYGTNNGRGLKISDNASFLSRIGVSGMDYAISQLGFGSMRGNADVIRGLTQMNARVNLGGQIGMALSMFGGMGGVNITGKQSEKIMETLMKTLGGMRASLNLTKGGPFNTRGPSGMGVGGVFSGPSSKMASRIAGLTAGTGAGRNRAGGHSRFRRDRFSGRMASLMRDRSKGLAKAGFDGFDIGVSRSSFGLNQRIGNNAGQNGYDILRQRQGKYASAVRDAYSNALNLASQYNSLIPVFDYDPLLSDLDDFSSLGGAVNRLSSWRNTVQNMLSLSFQNQAQIELDSRRGRDELEDRIRFQERLAKISSGVSSI